MYFASVGEAGRPRVSHHRPRVDKVEKPLLGGVGVGVVEGIVCVDRARAKVAQTPAVGTPFSSANASPPPSLPPLSSCPLVHVLIPFLLQTHAQEALGAQVGSEKAGERARQPLPLP